MPRPRKQARLYWRKERSTWVILDAGREFGTGCGEGEGAEAEKRLQEYLAGKHDPAAASCRPAARTPVADVVALYLDEKAPGQSRPEKVAERCERLLEWWGEAMLSDITPKSCASYAEARRRGGARRDLEDLRAAVNHHAARGLHSGVVTVTLPEKGKPRSRYMTRSEVAALLWACWRHRRPQRPPRGHRKGEKITGGGAHDLRHVARFILMGVYTGSRTAPILRASIHAGAGRAFLDLDAGRYYRLPEDMVEAENKQARVCTIPPRLLAHLRRWRDQGIIASHVVEWNGRPVASIKTAWRTAVEAAGLRGRVTPHTTRHTCVTWLKQAGVSSFEVGHFVAMSEAMVEHVYGHHDPAFQQNAVRALNRRRT